MAKPYYWTFSFRGFRPYRFLKPIRSHCAKISISMAVEDTLEGVKRQNV